MFTARASSNAMIVSDINACTIVSTFAQRFSTAVSVGESAVNEDDGLGFEIRSDRGGRCACERHQGGEDRSKLSGHATFSDRCSR